MKNADNYPYQNLSLVDMKGEIWKDIPGFEGYYQASNLGRIKSLAREVNFYRQSKTRVRLIIKTDKIVEQYVRKPKKNSFTGKNNYHITCALKAENIQLGGSVARLIYRTFIQDINKLKERVVVSHYDNDPLNNRVENLYIQTISELNRQNIREGRLIPPNIKELPKETQTKIYQGRLVPIAQYTLDGKLVATYSSMTEATRKLGISSGNLSTALNLPDRTCSGFIWKKLEKH